VSINFPPYEDVDEDVFAFAGFVKPGRHVIVIFDPEHHAFYYKDLVVEVRKSEIVIEDRDKNGKVIPHKEHSHLDPDSGLLEMGDDGFIFNEWEDHKPEYIH